MIIGLHYHPEKASRLRIKKCSCASAQGQVSHNQSERRRLKRTRGITCARVYARVWDVLVNQIFFCKQHQSERDDKQTDTNKNTNRRERERERESRPIGTDLRAIDKNAINF